MAGTSFHMFGFRFIPEMFSALSAAFLCISFVFLLVWLFIIMPFIRFRELNFNGNDNECDGCVSVRYNFLFIFLLLFTKVHKTKT